jgi:ketosteroid isomerase-like protein
VKILSSLLFTLLLGSNISVLGQETDQAKPDASVLDAIAERESQYLDGLLHRNFEELASVLDDTYVNRSPFGPVRNKVEFLEALKADTSRISEITETEKQTQVYGDTAIVIVKFEVHGTDEGEAFQFDGRAVDIWAKLNGEWLCVAVTVSQTRWCKATKIEQWRQDIVTDALLDKSEAENDENALTLAYLKRVALRTGFRFFGHTSFSLDKN